MPSTSQGSRRDADPRGRPVAAKSSEPRRRARPGQTGRADGVSEGGSADLEPLAASWQPATGHGRRAAEEPENPSGLRGLHTRFGWRLYALPLLLVLTVVVVFDVVRTPAEPPANAGGADGAPVDAGGGPSPTEPTDGPISFEPVDVEIGAAQLPEGDDFPATGSGEFRVLPGSTEVIGEEGALHTYTVEIEDGMEVEMDEEAFSASVDQTLADPRSWPGLGGVTMQRTDDPGAEPDLRITLASQETTSAACGEIMPFEVSCLVSDDGGDRAYLNAARWARGAHSYESNLADYRQYMVNHEVGHHLGLRHVACGTDGELARVMMDQTVSLADDDLSLLGEAGDIDGDVPAEGAVCRPNAWPFPVID
ncbi:DUF3152 domain-containing protein [Actinoalloteichus hymeniacidonis]|uniref:DUF3152 domain-containing protein n=1 Tax=Actinoalloteichus hymeniacidonis TaxID=340345 RepID=UPI0015602FDB|nr:DUF3152 domain-containing protein [Actinoalloteichus hymeniacidonis]MBB5910194.1 hypothetical protein [Actinoalloteichus hymeniacidonis]